jgi:hypothetical protein
LYTEFIVSPFKEKFPEEKLFCEPSALFSDGDAPTVACCGESESASGGPFRDKPVLSGDGATTGCCDAQFDRRLGQVPQRLGRPAVHLYAHQGRIEMQHLARL